MKFTEIIKEIRITENLSQANLAALLNVNQTTVSKWELGLKKPSYENILAIYNKFGITPNQLFGIEE